MKPREDQTKEIISYLIRNNENLQKSNENLQKSIIENNEFLRKVITDLMEILRKPKIEVKPKVKAEPKVKEKKPKVDKEKKFETFLEQAEQMVGEAREGLAEARKLEAQVKEKLGKK